MFSWSLPFLAEKVSSMLYTIVKKCTNLDDEEEKDDVDLKALMGEDIQKLPRDEAKIKKRQLIKGKIQSVGKMSKMFTTLRED